MSSDEVMMKHKIERIKELFKMHDEDTHRMKIMIIGSLIGDDFDRSVETINKKIELLKIVRVALVESDNELDQKLVKSCDGGLEILKRDRNIEEFRG